MFRPTIEGVVPAKGRSLLRRNHHVSHKFSIVNSDKTATRSIMTSVPIVLLGMGGTVGGRVAARLKPEYESMSQPYQRFQTLSNSHQSQPSNSSPPSPAPNPTSPLSRPATHPHQIRTTSGRTTSPNALRLSSSVGRMVMKWSKNFDSTVVEATRDWRGCCRPKSPGRVR